VPATSRADVTLTRPALAVSRALATAVRSGRRKALTIVATATTADGAETPIPLQVPVDVVSRGPPDSSGCG